MTAGDRIVTYTNMFTDRTLTFKVATQFSHDGSWANAVCRACSIFTSGDPTEISREPPSLLYRCTAQVKKT